VVPVSGVQRPIKGDPAGRGVGGFVTLDDEEAIEAAVFDLALTPCLVVGGNGPASIDYWLLSQRTTLDTRPRNQAPPWNHIGVRPPNDLDGGEYQTILELVETKQHQCRAGGDSGGAAAFERIAQKLKAALRTEDDGDR
jgi:hypothetical protein